MTDIRLPAEPALKAFIDAAFPNTASPQKSGALAGLIGKALKHGLGANPLDLADAIDALTWPRASRITVTLPASDDADLRELFHRVSLALPLGRRAPRLDPDALVAGCLIIYGRQPDVSDTLSLPETYSRTGVVPPKTP